MKQYVIDELRYGDVEKIRGYLEENLEPSGIDGVYWLPIDDAVLSTVQTAHAGCRPFYFAVELTPERLACELLVRTQNRVRCNCMGYATREQFFWLMEKMDDLLHQLDIVI